MSVLASSRVKITSLQKKKRCIFGDKCLCQHVEAEGGKPSKKSKKGGAKGSVAILQESLQLSSVSQDSYPRKSLQREPENLGSKHAVKFSQGTWHQMKTRERKGASRRIIKKCAPHERSPCAPKFGERHLAPRRMGPQSSMEFFEKHLQAQEFGQSYVKNLQ